MAVHSVGISDKDEWDRLVMSCDQFDFHHLSGYHELEARRVGGESLLLVSQAEAGMVLLPIIVQGVHDVPGLEKYSLFDATSVYGYAGPIAAVRSGSASGLSAQIEEIVVALRERRIVALFSRLHPLLEDQNLLLATRKDVHSLGQTVSIDLTLSDEDQSAGYRENHRRNIRKLKASGFDCVRVANPSLEDVQRFASIYEETMMRVGAQSLYFFDLRYFLNLIAISAAGFTIFMCTHAGEAICAGLFSHVGGIVQYHLGGTRTQYLRFAPMKLLFDYVRQWGSHNGARIFHLGGGAGGANDSLFAFKRGFSKATHESKLWKCAVMKEAYAELCEERARCIGMNSKELQKMSFFPAFRCEQGI